MAGHFAGKVALVTGASSGIGEAAALALGEAGASVLIAARRADRLEDLARRIEAAGGKALALAGDVIDEAFAVSCVEQAVATFGRIDILINSAGIIRTGGVESTKPDEYRQSVELNLFATLYTCRAAIPHMRAQGAGDIINISSQAGRKVAAAMNSYSASKFALNAMTDGLRQEVGMAGIRVATLMPGATRTEVGDSISDPNFRSSIQQHVSKDGAMEPKDVADTIIFMLSLPRRANLSDLTIRPTIDVTA